MDLKPVFSCTLPCTLLFCSNHQWGCPLCCLLLSSTGSTGYTEKFHPLSLSLSFLCYPPPPLNDCSMELSIRVALATVTVTAAVPRHFPHNTAVSTIGEIAQLKVALPIFHTHFPHPFPTPISGITSPPSPPLLPSCLSPLCSFPIRHGHYQSLVRIGPTSTFAGG